jgi:hypothetical protein
MKRRRNYREIRDTVPEGSRWTAWEFPTHRSYRLACCDCGLVHEMDFRVDHGELLKRDGRVVRRKSGHVSFRVARDNRATAMLRRHKEPTLNKTFLYHAADSLIALYAECPDQLDGFLRRFRAKVKQKIAEKKT